MQYKGRQDGGQRINRPNGQVNAAGDDDERCADRHYGDEAGVLCQLRQVPGVEELVLLDHDPFRASRGAGSEFSHLDGSPEQREQKAEHKNHNQQTAFLQAGKGMAC